MQYFLRRLAIFTASWQREDREKHNTLRKKDLPNLTANCTMEYNYE